MTGRTGAPARPIVACGLRRDFLDGDSELHCLLDEVVGDARAREDDGALRHEVEQLAVAAEGCGPSVPVPVRLAHDLVHAVPFGPLRGELLDAGAAAVHEHHVAVLGEHLVEAGEHRVRVSDVFAARDGNQGAVRQARAGLAWRKSRASMAAEVSPGLLGCTAPGRRGTHFPPSRPGACPAPAVLDLHNVASAAHTNRSGPARHSRGDRSVADKLDLIERKFSEHQAGGGLGFGVERPVLGAGVELDHGVARFPRRDALEMREPLAGPLRALGTAAGAMGRASTIRAGVCRTPAGIPLAGTFVFHAVVAALTLDGGAHATAGFAAEGRP